MMPKAKTKQPPKKLAHYLTPDDRREAVSIADEIDRLLTQHRQEGHVPTEPLRMVRYRLMRLASVQDESGWHGTPVVT
jgi:hypothetical protein